MGAVAEPRHALLGDGVRGWRGPAAEQLRSDRGSLDTEGVLHYRSSEECHHDLSVLVENWAFSQSVWVKMELFTSKF